MRRRTGIVALLATLVVLALAGCVRFQADLHVNPDDTVDGSIVVAVVVGDDADARVNAEASAEQIETQLLPNLSGAPGVTREVYDEDGYLGSRFSFSKTPLDALSGGGDGSLSLVRDGDEFTFNGTLDFTPGDEVEEVPQDADTPNITVAVTFPGEVIEHNGAVTGTTVRWESSFEGRIDMDARASATPAGLPAWLWGVAVGALLVLIVVAVAVIVRTRRNSGGEP